METFKVIVELLKIIIWPVVTVILITLFLKEIKELLGQFKERFSIAENLEIGFFGQEIKLSGTALKLLNEKEKFITSDQKHGASKDKGKEFITYVKGLADSTSDIVGLTLAASPKREIDEYEMTYHIMKKMGFFVNKFEEDNQRFVVLNMYYKVVSSAENLRKVGLVSKDRNILKLTLKGIEFFNELQLKEDKVLNVVLSMKKQDDQDKDGLEF